MIVLATFLLFVFLFCLTGTLFKNLLPPLAPPMQPSAATPADKIRQTLCIYRTRRRKLLTRKQAYESPLVHILPTTGDFGQLQKMSSRRLRQIQQQYWKHMDQKQQTTSSSYSKRRRKQISTRKLALKCASLQVQSLSKTDRFYFPITLENKVTFDVLLDCGSQSCLISENIFTQLPDYENIPDANSSHNVYGVGDVLVPQSRPPKLITLTYGDVTVQHMFTVLSQPDEFLVGVCLMNHMSLNVLRKTTGGPAFLYSGGLDNLQNETKLTGEPEARKPTDLFSSQEVELQPLEAKFVECCSDKTTVLAADRLSLLSPQLHSPIQTQECIQDLSTKKCRVLVTNTASHTLTLKQGEVIATAVPLGTEDLLDSHDGLTRGSPCGPLKVNTSTVEETVSPHETFPISPPDPPLRSQSVKTKSSDLLEEEEEYDPDTEAEGLPLPSECPSFDYEEEIKNSTSFPTEFKEPFLKFLREEVPGLCSANEYDFGTLTLGHKFNIELKAPKTHTSRPYKLNFVRQQQLDYAMGQLVKAGILKKGDSPYTSPAFLISKAPDKQGVSKTRVIFDMRQLNENTVKDHFPLPHIPTLLQDLKGGCFYSTLDLRGAFHNVEMTEGAKKKSAIITSSGIFLPQRMVFGLANCPSYFSFIISEVIKNLPFCRAYIDDIIIRTESSDPMDHLRDIQAVLRRLHEAGMRVNVLKGTYFAKEVEFLGKILNKDGIRPLNKHVDAIHKFPRPTTRKTLQRFLGLVAWVSCFIYNFSSVTKPLTKLVGRRIHYQWEDEQEEAFLNIKSLISSRCISYHPDFEEPFYLASDVCKDSYGSILYQVKSYSEKDIPALLAIQNENSNPPSSVSTEHPVLPSLAKGVPPALHLCKVSTESDDFFQPPPYWGNLKARVISVQDQVPMDQKVHVIRPIGFSSCTFTGASKNYTILEKETKGLLKAIATFQQFLYCAKRSYVVTDSQSFLWTLRFKSLGISRLERMCIKLLALPYKLIITHQKGKNLPADFMTRIWAVPSNDDGISDINAKNAVIIKTPFDIGQVVSTSDILEALRSDPQIVYIPSKEEIHSKKKICAITTVKQIADRSSNILKIDLQAAPTDLLSALSLDNILAEQRNDETTADIITRIQENPDNVPGYFMDKGLLYKRRHERDSNQDGRLYIPLKLLPLVLAYYHYNSHCGYRILTKLISPDFYSPYLDQHARGFTSSCHLCSTLKPSQHGKTSLGVIPLPAGKAQEWVMDMVVGLPSHDGFDAFLSIIDPYSGFRLAFPCKKTLSAPQAVKILQLYVIQIFGIPRRFSSDQGPNLLKAKAFHDFLKFHGIEKHVGLPYSAKSHGRIEASNKSIQELLRILSEQHDITWPRILHYVVLNLNSRPYSHLQNLSPFEVMFNLKHQNLKERLDFKVELYSFAEHKALFDNLDGQLSRLLKQAEADLQAKRETSSSPAYLNEFYQQGHLVYVKDFRILPKKKFKQRFYSAPFLILRAYDHALLVRDFFGITRLIHKDNVRPCTVREAYLFDDLPISVKQAVGFPFSNKEIENAVLEGRIPEFWDDLPQEPPPPPNTRANRHLYEPDLQRDHFTNPQVYDDDPDLALYDDDADPYDDSWANTSDEETEEPDPDDEPPLFSQDPNSNPDNENSPHSDRPRTVTFASPVDDGGQSHSNPG